MLISGGLTKHERDKLVTKYWDANARTSWPLADTLTSEQRTADYRTQDRILDEYAERLPFVTVSRCPYTKKLAEYPMDPYGFDGMWWKIRELAEYPPAAGSEYLRLISGGVDFHGRDPLEAKRLKEVRPGPGCPYVIPGILKMDGMMAVVSKLDLPQGDTAYITAYFSETPVHGGLLSQPWGRDSYQVFDEAGEYEAWTVDTSNWDFDLATWIEQGKLFWITPGDEGFNLNNGRECPYLGLEGIRQPQVILNGVIKLGELPDGKPAQPFE